MTALATTTVTALAVGACALAAGAPAAAAPRHAGARSTTEVYRFSGTTTTMQVYWRGNGHGHGMSQYGAEGAAQKGLTAAQILAFYYPGATLTTIKVRFVRVLLSGTTANTTVFAGPKGLAISGHAALPATGYQYFRLVPQGTGLAVQGLPTPPTPPASTSGSSTGTSSTSTSGSATSGSSGTSTSGSSTAPSWRTVLSGLPARADFTDRQHFLRVLMADGSSTRYRGRVGAVRNGAGEQTINRLTLDNYVKGVVPREMPSSWDAAALQAQAIAARSYALSEIEADNPGDTWDICDTTMCQVYGGMAHLDRSGNVVYRNLPSVVDGNNNEVLTYQGGPILAQYSASNGGATVAGGEPYLVGRSDPYDTYQLSGDPYLNQSRQVSARTFASSFGLATVSSVTVTKRDGNGPWGGRVVSAKVTGTTAKGAARTVSTDGIGLGNATATWTDYLRFGS